ncbi:large conductance mechanosensitive channel protein MscL [Zymobacter palmae]|uniref:Large-conductance mechanosensitive channel n=1 Tax=Zymobacter palmae TaxID=33074 RepID=A0A348HF40_9GAMM|nr:large conductance mechanosensitive channel protein MscL [Zymobacter palmae]BBG30242.1 large-conductance mechanosensitive channel [Zymobacter palmae]
MASQFLKDFRKFAVKGNVVDMAIGIIIGAAFTSIVNSLVKDILTPIIGLFTGGLNFDNMFVVLREGAIAGPYPSLDIAQKAGAVTINYGNFLNAAISFIIVAFVCFMLVRMIGKLQRKEETEVKAPTTKECPFCASTIPLKATRCPSCTSELGSTAGTMADSEATQG